LQVEYHNAEREKAIFYGVTVMSGLCRQKSEFPNVEERLSLYLNVNCQFG